MKFINTLEEGNNISDFYMVKQSNILTTKAGKEYINMMLQDKTGMINAKIWEPNDPAIGNFDNLDYVEVTGEVTSFNGALQVNVKRIRKAEIGEINEADFLPTTDKNVDEMMTKLLGYIENVNKPYYKELLEKFFVEDTRFVEVFKKSSAAKSMHHAFVGGLLEHTLSVTEACDFYSKQYAEIDRDLLITSAIFHDIGKTVELSKFPENDYTDAGQLLGHIVIGTEMIREKASSISDFPTEKLRELIHCILAHHGELEYGSPKEPALIEALILNIADDADAKIEMFKEGLLEDLDQGGWTMKKNFPLDRKLRKTSK